MDKKYLVSYSYQIQRIIINFLRILFIGFSLLILFGQKFNNGSIYIQSNKFVVIILLMFYIFTYFIDNLFSTIIISSTHISIFFDIWKVDISWNQIQSIYKSNMIPYSVVYVITLNRRMPFVYYFYSLFFLGITKPAFVINARQDGCSEILNTIYQKTNLTPENIE
jgi:hypothetical protein